MLPPVFDVTPLYGTVRMLLCTRLFGGISAVSRLGSGSENIAEYDFSRSVFSIRTRVFR
jgi:hypothetical protein